MSARYDFMSFLVNALIVFIWVFCMIPSSSGVWSIQLGTYVLTDLLENSMDGDFLVVICKGTMWKHTKFILSIFMIKLCSPKGLFLMNDWKSRPMHLCLGSLVWLMNHDINWFIIPLNGTKYSRIDQVKFLESNL